MTLGVPGKLRQVHRRHAVQPRDLHVGTHRQQQFHRAGLAVQHRGDQRRVAVLVLGIDFAAGADQGRRDAGVAAGRRRVQRPLAAGPALRGGCRPRTSPAAATQPSLAATYSGGPSRASIASVRLMLTQSAGVSSGVGMGQPRYLAEEGQHAFPGLAGAGGVIDLAAPHR
jgi:hypothetical protein